MNRPRLTAFIAILLTSAGTVLGATSSASLFNDVLVAKGKNVEVRRGQLDDAFVAFKANLAARGQSIPEDRRSQVEAELLDRLVLSQLLVNKATAADKARAKETAAKTIEDARKSAGSEEGFQRQLKVLGMSAEQFSARANEDAITRELLDREIKSKVTITPEQIKAFYETNETVFRVPELARASHILFATRDMNTRLELPDDVKRAKKDKADKVLARARKGEDFAKLVEEFSEDPASKENKGEYKFCRAKDDPRRAMMPEFEAAAFSLRPGEISSVISSDYGYHIIKLLELIPATKTSLPEVSDKIRDHLVNQAVERQLPGYFGKLKKDAEVQILDEKLAEILAKTQKDSPK